MESIKVTIHDIKNIIEAELELPFENGIYTIVGANGCGKSTIMLCLGQLISNQLSKLTQSDHGNNASVAFEVDGKKVIWKYYSSHHWKRKGDSVFYKGMYEGSLFYGTRFEDSTNIEDLVEKGIIGGDNINNADEYVIQQMSYILHGDLSHYSTLKRIKNRTIAQSFGISNLPYFIEANSSLISQYRMSSGECLLVSLLHFLYNSIERRSIPINQKAIVIIDELELALHPIAVVRLMDYLKELVNEHPNLIVYLSTHSPEVIKAISPKDLYKITNRNGRISMENNCYPSYLIRDLYSSVSPDFLLLVEDKLSQLFVNRILLNYSLRHSKLIHCVPVGGWKQVLDLHQELYSKKILGTQTTIVSILDGDIESQLSKDQKKWKHLFLPINSIEKFLYSVLKDNANPKMRKIINDKYFIVRSLDEIIADYNRGTLNGQRDDNKNFYSYLCKELKNIGTSEEVFVSGLCDDIINNIDCHLFVQSLTLLLKE